MEKKSFLQHNVLVINKFWEPVNVTIVEDAIGMIYKEIADIVIHKSIKDKFDRIVANKFEIVDYNRWIIISDNLSEHQHNMIHSVKYKYLVPDIILLRKFGSRPKYYIKLSKSSIYNRDKGICQYCRVAVSKDIAEIDHIYPKSKGGAASWDNLVLSCPKCNFRKKDKTIAEIGYKLIRKPIKPTSINFSDIYKKEYELWRKFVEKNEDTDYTNE